MPRSGKVGMYMDILLKLGDGEMGMRIVELPAMFILPLVWAAALGPQVMRGIVPTGGQLFCPSRPVGFPGLIGDGWAVTEDRAPVASRSTELH